MGSEDKKMRQKQRHINLLQKSLGSFKNRKTFSKLQDLLKVTNKN